MEEQNANVEIFEDDSVIELYDENEQAVKFREIASIELDGKFYELLQPVEPIDGIGEDEAVIFEYTEVENSDERNFTPLFDEKLLDRVFGEYLKAVSDCDCGCCDCDDGCDCDHDHDCDCDHDHAHGHCGGHHHGDCDCGHHHH